MTSGTSLRNFAMSDNRPLTHLAASIIAMAALIVSLTVWPALVRERGTADWSIAAYIAAISGSLYLLLSALATGWSAIYGNCLRFRNAAPDVLLVLVTCWMLWRGMEARSLLAGLGALLPSLATVAAVMIFIRLMPSPSSEATASAPRSAGRQMWIEIARIAAAAVVAIALVDIEIQEIPSAKPWSESSPASNLLQGVDEPPSSLS